MQESWTQARGWTRRTLVAVSLLVVLLVSLTSGAVGYRLRELFGERSPLVEAPLPQTRELISEESTVIRVVKKTSPAVVSIAVSRRVVDPFSPLADAPRRESGIGTGFIISSEGLIITNRHVVSDGNLRYIVVTKDDKKYPVQRVYRDPTLDIAIVKIDATNLPKVNLGDSGKLEIGQLVIAVGNALGRFKNTVTTGVVSGIRPEGVEAGDPFSGFTEQLGEVIQTDAAINPGNSGGPLLDSSGNVVGVNVAVSQGAENIGFAIPVNVVKPVIDEFLRTGKISRPYLGVRYELVSRARALAFEVPEGAYVREVMDGSPAQRAGIKVGDIIVNIDNQRVDENTPLAKAIQSKKVGDSVEIVINREGGETKLTIVLGEAPTQF